MRYDPSMRRKAFFIVFAAVLFCLDSPLPSFSADATLVPAPSISHQFRNHIHGIGYDSGDRRLFIATHYGIFVWKEGQLFQLGESRDDFMGFSLHPFDSKIMYTSGHPKTGGNMGVMKSEDGGATFRQIFRGLRGETVDFHSMAISPANPKILYGWFQERLYRSKDAGKSWQLASARGLPVEGFCFGAPCLTPDTKNERLIYAGTPKGLHASHDFGENWNPVTADLGAVAGVGVDPSNPQRLFAFTQKFGLASSPDSGKSWQPRSKGLELSTREFVFALAFDRRSAKNIFAATPEKIFRSNDGGRGWERIL